MADKSAIEWTDATWNPTVGCSIVSPGCTNCYAMKVANGLERRFDSPKYRGLTKVVNGNAVWTGEVRLDEAALLQPLKWKRGRRIFVNSMSDLFHESLSDADIDRVFAVMALAPQHTFQVLTKRAERMRQWFANVDRADSVGLTMLTLVDRIPYGHRRVPWPLPNVWLGVSAERQEEAAERIPHLLSTPAAIRFVSLEPLLGPIDLEHIAVSDDAEKEGWTFSALTTGDYYTQPNERQLADDPVTWNSGDGPYRDQALDWVIVGGESGPRARPMHPQWARDIRDQCAEAGVPFFFKQWGALAPQAPKGDVKFWRGSMLAKHVVAHDYAFMRVGKKAAGRLLDGREHSEFPQVSA